MTSIKHRIIMEVTPAKLYAALTTQQGLSSWWTKAETNGEVGSVANFYFGPEGQHVVPMKIIDHVQDKQVIWQSLEGPWANTGFFTFSIQQDERGAALVFEHAGWAEADDFFAHCNAKWGFFFTVSLKSYLETGTGVPSPHEPKI